MVFLPKMFASYLIPRAYSGKYGILTISNNLKVTISS